MYNIIIEKNIPTLYRADSRGPEEIKKAGGFSMSRSIDTDGTLGKYDNGRAIEPIIYTAETFGGMRRFVDKMFGERYFYQLNSLGLSVARYKKNFEATTARRNLTLHLKKQTALMKKIIGDEWENKSDREIGNLLFMGCPGDVAWYDLTVDAEECHIIGTTEQLHAPELFYTNGPLPIMVSLDRISYIGTKSKGRSSLPMPLA